MLRGLTTVSLYADDVAAARDWYAALLGVDAYFERAMGDALAYVEFRIGDRSAELGIVDSRFAPYPAGTASGATPSGAVVYWHVDDVEAAVARLLEHGATALEPIRERGEGFVTASVADPFGNVLGVMFNQHYLDVLAGKDLLVEEN